jgi:hypothetical protein
MYISAAGRHGTHPSNWTTERTSTTRCCTHSHNRPAEFVGARAPLDAAVLAPAELAPRPAPESDEAPAAAHATRVDKLETDATKERAKSQNRNVCITLTQDSIHASGGQQQHAPASQARSMQHKQEKTSSSYLLCLRAWPPRRWACPLQTHRWTSLQ